MTKRTQLVVDSLAAQRVLDKLAREQIPVFSAEKTAKNKITFCIATKDLEKVFAILSGLCYNITEVRRRGLSLLFEKLVGGLGLVLGIALFCLGVVFFQGRVLKVEIVGSGAYYEERVLDVLSKGGVKKFAPIPKNTALLSAEILGFPDVCYCDFRASGGILTVEVEVEPEHSLREINPFVSPVKGKIEAMLVLRGTPFINVGDEVEAGQLLVDAFEQYGEQTRPVVVIAAVTIACPVSEIFEGDEESARLNAYLKYGEMTDVKAEKRDEGFLITGIYHLEATMNLN